MQRQATKSVSEREDEESDRLVRPAPKQKPPRADRRRERMDVEDDPDLDESDPDTSMNYKTIGGSQTKASKTEKIPAKNSDGKIVYVTPKTLKEKPGEYKAVKPEETKELYDQASPNMSDDDMAGWANQMETLARQNPGKAVDEVFPKGTFPPEVKTLGDLVSLLDTGQIPIPDEPPPTKQKLPPPAAPEKEAPGAAKEPEKAPEAAPAAPAAKEPEKAPEGPATPPSEEGKAPAAEAAPKEEPAKAPDSPDGDKQAPAAESKKQAPKKGPPPVKIKRPPASPADWKRASLDLIDMLPPKEAAAILAMPDMHPSDINRMTAAFRAGKAKGIDDGFKGAVSVTGVSPPEEWDGKPLADMSPEDKASATRAHAMETVGRTLGARAKLMKDFQKPGSLFSDKPLVSKGAAKHLAEVVLGVTKGNPAKLMAEGLKNGRPLSDREKKTLLKAYPKHREALVGYMQGTDVKKVKDKFIGSGWGQVSEFSSVGAIARGVFKATSALNSARKLYGLSEFDETEASKLFKAELLSNMRQLRSKKYDELKTKVEELEAYDYTVRLKSWEKSHKAWQKAKDTFEAQANKGGDYRKAPAKFDTPEPQAPQEYLTWKKDIRKWEHDKQKKEKIDKWERDNEGPRQPSSKSKKKPEETDDAGPPEPPNTPKTARDSSCYPLKAMSSRHALYYGVDPEDHFLEVDPIHIPRPFDDSDEKPMVAAARAWLKKPLLKGDSWAFVDQKFRIALDLAIHNSQFAASVPPPAYDRMLYMLMGDSAELKQARAVLAKVNSQI